MVSIVKRFLIDIVTALHSQHQPFLLVAAQLQVAHEQVQVSCCRVREKLQLVALVLRGSRSSISAYGGWCCTMALMCLLTSNCSQREQVRDCV